MFPDGGKFDVATNIDVAKDGLTDELATGTVNLVAEPIGFFKKSGGQSEQEARHTRCPFVCAYLLYLCFAALQVPEDLEFSAWRTWGSLGSTETRWVVRISVGKG